MSNWKYEGAGWLEFLFAPSHPCDHKVDDLEVWWKLQRLHLLHTIIFPSLSSPLPRYRICCPLCCFLDSHFVVSVTPFAVSVAHFVEMCPHFVDSETHFVVSDQQNGNVFFQNVMCRPECWFSVWVESTNLVTENIHINNSCQLKKNQQIVSKFDKWNTRRGLHVQVIFWTTVVMFPFTKVIIRAAEVVPSCHPGWENME